MKLIVEMEMQKCCWECACCDTEYQYCVASRKQLDDLNERPDWCPIIGVLPDEHGDLIDRDALMIELMDRGIEGVQIDDLAEFQQIVMDAKAVIAAERKDDEQIH